MPPVERKLIYCLFLYSYINGGVVPAAFILYFHNSFPVSPSITKAKLSEVPFAKIKLDEETDKPPTLATPIFLFPSYPNGIFQSVVPFDRFIDVIVPHGGFDIGLPSFVVNKV